MNITIAKLERAEHQGDWHDKPLRYSVTGPGAELQKFSTKKEAMLYRKIRRRSTTFLEASNAFCNA